MPPRVGIEGVGPRCEQPVKKAQSLGVELADLDVVLKNADYITIHTPLTEETHREPEVLDNV